MKIGPSQLKPSVGRTVGEPMRPARLSCWLVAPVAVWVAGDGLLSTWRAGLNLQRMPTLVERLLLTAGMWSLQALPFAVILSLAAAPPLTLIAAWLIRPTRTRSPLTLEALSWLGMYLASLILALPLLWINRMPGALVLLFWSASVGQALSVALAYHVQKTLQLQGVSRVPGGVVLIAGVAAELLAHSAWLIVLLMPGLAEWRVMRRRRPTTGCS